MRADQWIYTTSCWNRSLSSGWGTFSCSPGLTQEEIDELERLCKIPQSLDESYFPLFIFLTMKNGRQVVAQSAYIGQSYYDSRPGATITHAFVLEKGATWPVPPVNYMASESFWRDLPEEIKRKALELRAAGNSRLTPPPPLRTIEVDSIESNRKYSALSIQQRLDDREFALGASQLVQELEQLREDQLPLTFRCKESDYMAYVAATAYLLPMYFSNSAAASFYSTFGSISEYSFLKLTGSTDSPRLDLTVSAGTNIHPIVRVAAEDLPRWTMFADKFASPVRGRSASILSVYKILYTATPVTDAILSEAMQPAFSGDDVTLPLLLAYSVFSRDKLGVSGSVFLSFCESFLKISEKILASNRSSDAVDRLRSSLQGIIRHISDYLLEGKIADEECARIIRPQKVLVRLWLSASHLAPLILSNSSKAARMHLMRFSQMLAGENNIEWADSAPLQDIVAQFASSTEWWSEFIAPCSDIGIGGALWLLQHRLAAEYDTEVAYAMAVWLSRFPADQANALRKQILEKSATRCVAEECRAWIGKGDSIANLLSIQFLLDAHPELIPSMVQVALPGTHPYHLESGIRLLTLIKSVSDAATIAAIAKTIVVCFPSAQKPSSQLIAFAQDAQTRLKRAGVSERIWRRLDFYCRLNVLSDIVSTELPDFLEHTYLPFFEKHSALLLDEELRKEISPWFLRLLLENASTQETHSCILSQEWRWDESLLLTCYEDRLKSCSAKVKVINHPRTKVILRAMLNIDDSGLFQKMVERLVPIIFPRASNRQLCAVGDELRLCPGSLQDKNWRAIVNFASNHRKSLLGELFSFLTRK